MPVAKLDTGPWSSYMPPYLIGIAICELDSGTLSFFFCCCDTLTKGMIYYDADSRVQSILVRETWQQELEGVGCIVSFSQEVESD